MAVLVHVRAVARRRSLGVYLSHKATFYNGIKAVVDRRHGNIGHRLLCPQKDLIGGWMIEFAQQHGVDVFTLWRNPKPALPEPLLQEIVGELVVMVSQLHCGKPKGPGNFCQYLY